MVTARFSAISTGTMVNGVWYKPVEQFILPKVSFSHVFRAVAWTLPNGHPEKNVFIAWIFHIQLLNCSFCTKKSSARGKQPRNDLFSKLKIKC